MPAKRLPFVKLWHELMESDKVRQLTDSQYRTWTYTLMSGSQQPTRWRFNSLEHIAYVTRRPLKDVQGLADMRFLDVQDDVVWIHDAAEYQEVSPSDIGRERSVNGQSKPPPSPGNGSAHHSANGRRTLGERSLEIEIEKEKEKNTPVDEVYEHFKSRVQPRSRLCPTRKIATRLKRFTPAELIAGIDHFADDPWWMEHCASRGAEWFFESDARSEQFLLMVPRPAANVVQLNRPARTYVDKTGVAN